VRVAFLGLKGAADTVPGYQAELRAVLQENIACSLLWVNAHSIVCDDSARLSWDLELICSKLEHSCEWSFLWDLKHPEGELGVGGEGDLEGHLGHDAKLLGLM